VPTEPLNGTIEPAARDILSRLLPGIAPTDIDRDRDLTDGYGLTSLNRIVLLTSLCTRTGVPASAFTEADLAAMRTLDAVVRAFQQAGPENPS
jgi:hypothetical protein